MRNIVLFKISSIALVLLLVLQGCQKVSGDFYKYDNPNAVFAGSTYQFLQSQQGLYDSLLLVIDKIPDIREKLQSGSATFFAASNKSFEIALENLNVFRALQGRPPLYLQQADSTHLDTLMRRYIFNDRILTDSISMLSGGQEYPSIGGHMMHLKYERRDASGYMKGGPQVIVFSDMKDSQFERYWVKTSTNSVNINTTSGIVHILAGTHEFGFGEYAERMNK